MDAPLDTQPKDPGARTPEHPVGYGSAGADAFEFSLDDGVVSDIGFLKLFVSTTYVDMMALEQLSPFDTIPGGVKTTPPSLEIWDAWTYVLKTQRRESGRT
jgi:hypothetical protein